MKTLDLSGAVAMVTGGGQGLGAAICTVLAGCGATVVVNYFDDDEGINRNLAQQLAHTLGNGSMAMRADVRCLTQTQVMFEAIMQTFGKIDIVVNNAGVLRDRTLKKMTVDEWNLVIDTNLTGVFNVCKSAVDKLTRGGRIVNIASIAGIVGFFGQTNYAASKAGVIGLTKALNKELGSKAITVNAVAPGIILTEMGKSIPEEVRAEQVKLIPLGRFGEVEDVAHAVLFLCSDMANYITGQVLQVNGGWIG